MEKHSSSRLRFIYLPAQPSGIVLGKTTLRFNNTTNNLFVSLFLTCRKAESPVFSFLCSFHLHLPYLALIIASSGFVVVVYLLCCFQLILCSNRKKKKRMCRCCFYLAVKLVERNTKHFKGRIFGVSAKSPTKAVQEHCTMEGENLSFGGSKISAAASSVTPGRKWTLSQPQFPSLPIGRCP